MAGKRILVCGGRTYGLPPRHTEPLPAGERARLCNIAKLQADFLFRSMDSVLEEEGGMLEAIIHGGAPGADTIVDRWARARHVPLLVFQADWTAHGHAAGPIRNAQMIAEGGPDKGVSFPGGRGTLDMVTRMLNAGLQVRQFK